MASPPRALLTLALNPAFRRREIPPSLGPPPRPLTASAPRFVLKDKDTCQAQSVQYLKAKGLFPQADEEEDDW